WFTSPPFRSQILRTARNLSRPDRRAVNPIDRMGLGSLKLALSSYECQHTFVILLKQKGKGEQTMKVRPLHDRVLIKRVEEQETVRGGIIIPDSAKEKPQEGEV